MFKSILFVESGLGSSDLLEYFFTLQYELLSDKHCHLLLNSKYTTSENKDVEIRPPAPLCVDMLYPSCVVASDQISFVLN